MTEAEEAALDEFKVWARSPIGASQIRLAQTQKRISDEYRLRAAQDRLRAELRERVRDNLSRADVSDVTGGCPCHACDSRVPRASGKRMSLCPTCGNKRCPGAVDHRRECGHSNEPGQIGSFWHGVTP